MSTPAATSADPSPMDRFNEHLGIASRYSPYPVLHRLRAESPVHPGQPEMGVGAPGPDQEPTFSLYGADLVSGVLADDATYSSQPYAVLIGMVFGRTALEMDEPEHRRYRQVLQAAFSKKEMRRWETGTVRPLIADTVLELAGRPSRRAELVHELCLPFPVRAVAALLGLPEESYQEFQRLAVQMISIVTDWDAAMAATERLTAMFAATLAERRARPRQDMISVLAHAESDGHRLTDTEILSFLRLLLPAGAETTYRLSSSLLAALLLDREQLELVRADRSLLARAVDEAVRWESPLQAVLRRAVRDVELAGVRVPAGAVLSCHLGAANHDPARFPDPESFDLRRPRGGGVGFGHGVHACLGMHLARMEAIAVVDELLDRLPGVRLDPAEPEPFVGGRMMRSVSRLHVVW